MLSTFPQCVAAFIRSTYSCNTCRFKYPLQVVSHRIIKDAEGVLWTVPFEVSFNFIPLASVVSIRKHGADHGRITRGRSGNRARSRPPRLRLGLGDREGRSTRTPACS